MVKKIYKCLRCNYMWELSSDKKPEYCPKCYRSSISEIKKHSYIVEKFQKFKKKVEEFRYNLMRGKSTFVFMKLMFVNST